MTIKRPLFRIATRTALIYAACLNLAQAGECPAPAGFSYLAAEAPAIRKVTKEWGQGEYSYRFTVRDPQRTGQPFRHGRYQVELKGEETFPDGTHFYRGTTDYQGRTRTFRFAAPVALENWYVQPLVGKGNYGESFQLTDETGCQEKLGNLPYLLNEELGGIFCGRTRPDGTTIRTMSQGALEIELYQTSEKECRSLQHAVNPAMTLTSPSSRIAALQRLIKVPRFSAHQDMLQGKIDALTIRYGSLAQVKALVSNQLATTPADKHSEILNNLGYQLLTQDPPRHLRYASNLLDQSLKFGENLYNLDSKAWALHLLGQDEEALQLINQALALYGTTCNEAESSSYPEALAHRGMIQWTMKRYSEALDDWTLAHMSTQAGGWANFAPSWDSIEALITARGEKLKEAAFHPETCSMKPDNQGSGEI